MVDDGDDGGDDDGGADADEVDEDDADEYGDGDGGEYDDAAAAAAADADAGADDAERGAGAKRRTCSEPYGVLASSAWQLLVALELKQPRILAATSNGQQLAGTGRRARSRRRADQHLNARSTVSTLNPQSS